MRLKQFGKNYTYDLDGIIYHHNYNHFTLNLKNPKFMDNNSCDLQGDQIIYFDGL